MNHQNTILLFWEDDDDFVKMFSFFLHKHGHFMENVKSFDMCIESCRSKPPALLIVRSFVNKPRDGLEFIRQLRLDLSISYFPVIVGWADFSSSTPGRGYLEAFESGANACFGRVYDVTDVLEEIELLLNNPMARGIVDRQTQRMTDRAKNSG